MKSEKIYKAISLINDGVAINVIAHGEIKATQLRGVGFYVEGVNTIYVDLSAKDFFNYLVTAGVAGFYNEDHLIVWNNGYRYGLETFFHKVLDMDAAREVVTNFLKDQAKNAFYLEEKIKSGHTFAKVDFEKFGPFKTSVIVRHLNGKLAA